MSDKLTEVKIGDEVKLIKITGQKEFFEKNGFEIGDKFKVTDVYINGKIQVGDKNNGKFVLYKEEYELAKRSKLEDALRCMEDAIDLRTKAQKKDLEAVQLLNEYHEERNAPKTKVVDNYIESNCSFQKATKEGIYMGTADNYRKYIVDQAKEELKNFDGRTADKLKIYRWKKEDVENGRVWFNEVFHVNKEKRTVVCLLKGIKSGYVYSKGVAKCDPNDTFNEHLGKIIAYYRSINEQVPEKYTNVPNPEKVQNGDIVLNVTANHTYELDNITETKDFIIADFKNVHSGKTFEGFKLIKKLYDEHYKIIDDSNRK